MKKKTGKGNGNEARYGKIGKGYGFKDIAVTYVSETGIVTLTITDFLSQQ